MLVLGKGGISHHRILESENETRNLREALEQLQCSSLARESDLASELLKVKEEFTAEIEKCSILKSDLTSELLSVKGDFTAEIEKCSILKSRYDQLVLTSGQTSDILNSAIDSTKAEMAAEIVKHGKCRTRVEAMEEEELKLREKIKDTKALKLRVKTLEEDGAKLCEEFKDTKASLKLKNDDLKTKHSKALISMKETHSSRVISLESSLKNKNKGITKLEERVRVLQEETVTLRSTIRLLKLSKVPAAPTPSEEPTLAASSFSYFTPLSTIFPLADLPTILTDSSRATPASGTSCLLPTTTPSGPTAPLSPMRLSHMEKMLSNASIITLSPTGSHPGSSPNTQPTRSPSRSSPNTPLSPNGSLCRWMWKCKSCEIINEEITARAGYTYR